VRSEVAGPTNSASFFFSRDTSLTARPTEEVGTSVITSTPSVSYHCRAMLEPISGLFWWSPEITWTGWPKTWPASSAAICAATTEPLPPISA